MSFSSEVKEELSKIGNLVNKNCVKKELIGYLLSQNINIEKSKIEFSTESEFNINRFAKLLNNINVLNYKIDIKGKIYTIEIKKENIESLIKDGYIKIDEDKKIKVGNIIIESDDEAKAIVRVAFLGSGYVSSKNTKNHLEVDFFSVENAKFIIEILNRYNINVKLISKGSKSSIYIKDGEDISKYLAFIGANKAVLDFEESRVQKEMNNKINRLVNCESSNLNKIINASVEQINAIKKLQESGRFELLNANLKEIALLRMENPDMSLENLGKLLREPLGKSGVNYRLKKIMEIANRK
jgi:hypothetical protein